MEMQTSEFYAILKYVAFLVVYGGFAIAAYAEFEDNPHRFSCLGWVVAAVLLAIWYY